MRIALCFSGLMRLYHDAFEKGWKPNIIDKFDKVDIFISTWDTLGYWSVKFEKGFSPESPLIDIQDIIDLYSPASLIVDKFDDFEPRFEEEKKKFEKCHTQTKNTLCMFYKHRQVLNDVQRYARENDIHYDFVIRTRPDMLIDPYNFQFDSETIYVHHRVNHLGTGWGSDFFACSFENLSIVANIYDELEALYTACGNILCPHDATWVYLNRHVPGLKTQVLNLSVYYMHSPTGAYTESAKNIPTLPANLPTDFRTWDKVQMFTLKDLEAYYAAQEKCVDDFDDKYYCEWMQIRCKRDAAKLLEPEATPESYNEIERLYYDLHAKYPNRIEMLEDIFCVAPDSKKKFEYASKMIAVPLPNPIGKHVIIDLYEWRALDWVVTEGYYAGQYQAAYDAWKRLMKEQKFPEDQQHRITNNGQYSRDIVNHRKSYDNFRNDFMTSFPKLNEIPNIIHFIWIHGQQEFSMIQYLAVRSAYEVQNPEEIYVYNDIQPRDNVWWERIKPYVKIVQLRVPEYINNRAIESAQHKIDLMKTYIVNYMGGIYLDSDFLLMKSLNHLRKHQIKVTHIGGCIIAWRNNSILEEKIRKYEEKYDGANWEETKLSNLSHIIPVKTYHSLDTIDLSSESLGVYLQNDLPKHTDYFDTHNNTFTRLFGKYIEEFRYRSNN